MKESSTRLDKLYYKLIIHLLYRALYSIMDKRVAIDLLYKSDKLCHWLSHAISLL